MISGTVVFFIIEFYNFFFENFSKNTKLVIKLFVCRVFFLTIVIFIEKENATMVRYRYFFLLM
jgi:hypothetical protein